MASDTVTRERAPTGPGRPRDGRQSEAWHARGPVWLATLFARSSCAPAVAEVYDQLVEGSTVEPTVCRNFLTAEVLRPTEAAS
jgi:hypothetical protein